MIRREIAHPNEILTDVSGVETNINGSLITALTGMNLWRHPLSYNLGLDEVRNLFRIKLLGKISISQSA